MLFGHEEKELLTVCRTDVSHPLASYSLHAFELDGFTWPSVEHYYNAMRYGDPAYVEKIRQSAHPKDAAKLGKSWWHKKRKDWNQVKVTVMTRATYIKCRSYPEIAQLLLDSGDIDISEVSQYDYFWGIGRDLRGENAYGKMLMDIRHKLREESASESPA